MFDVIPFICLVLCFLNVWVWMKSTCKDNIWMVGSVYNLNNVPFRCRSQMYFRCTDLLQGVVFPFFQKWIVQLKQFVCLVLGVGLVALLHLAWNCMKFSPNHQIRFHFSAVSFFSFSWLLASSWFQNGKVHFDDFLYTLFWFHMLFKALKRLYIFW